jgi:hypothetical protein
MTLFFYYGAGDLGDEAVRLGSQGFIFSEAAESGILAMNRVRIDDPTGALTITGHHAFNVRETACSFPWLFRGYFADRTYMRAPGLETGAARIIDGTVYDLNSALQFEVFRGTTAKRPAETDTQRLAWALGSAFLGPISSDGTMVIGAGVELDKQDYRGQTLADVLSDCATVSGNNYFVAYDDTLGAPVLHYYAPAQATFSSTVKISNVLADVDMATVYAPDKSAKLNKDPSRVFSGVYYQYGDSDFAAVYETSGAVQSAIGHKRETTEQDPSIKTATRASAKANRYLAEAATELDTIDVTLVKVRPADVNLIRAGHRIQVKFTHLPGYTSYTWMRVIRRAVRQADESQLFYELDLTLANPKQMGGRVRHKPRKTKDADTGTGAGTYTVTQLQSVHDNLIENDWYGLFTAGAPYIGSWVSQNTPYTTAGCPLGSGLWGPGGITWEAWYTVSVSGADGDVGVEVDMTTALGTRLGLMDTSGMLLVGWANAAPGGLSEFNPVGLVNPRTGGTVFVPGDLIDNGGTNYLVLAPAWRATNNWSICSNYISNPASGPVLGGEANSGRGIAILTSQFTLTPKANEQVGRSSWVTPIGSGTADGSNKTWTLDDWTGDGIPQARWGAVILSAATDYTVDSDALTITFRDAPPEGTRVAFRYQLGAAP